MRPVLSDTSAYAACMRGDPDIVETLAHAARLFMCSAVMGELLAGYAAGSREAKNREELNRFLNTPRVSVLPVTTNTAHSYAMVHAALRRNVQPVATNGLWIAASALEHGVARLSLDRRFAQSTA